MKVLSQDGQILTDGTLEILPEYYTEKEVEEIESKLGKKKLVCADLFSGSGIVARMLKKHSSKLIVNDLENYSSLINSCYLINKKDYPAEICADYESTSPCYMCRSE